MAYSDLRSPLLRVATVVLASTGLVGLWTSPGQASDQSVTYSETRIRAEHYQVCVSSLIQAGILEADGASACAASLYPRDLSRCVTQIGQGSEVAVTDALSGCRGVRRPLELATCVTEISEATDKVDPALILNDCRLSLLPTRFSSCVVGLGDGTTEMNPLDALQACIAAGDRPRNVRPNFVPAGQPIPPTPSSLPPIESQF